MAPIDFYFSRASAPCRSVLLVAKALGVPLNKKLLNLYIGEHLKPDFLKINPQHTVPTLVDNEFVMWESQAVIMYLADKYGKNDSLYPKDPKKRAVVNQRLLFDLGTFYRSFGDYYYPVVFEKLSYDPKNLKKIDNAFEALDNFLQGQTYVAGDQLSIADLALLASTTTFDVAGYDFKKYTNVTKWYENLKKTTPGWEENWEYCLHVKGWFEPGFTMTT